MANKKAVPKSKKPSVLPPESLSPFHFSGRNFHLFLISVITVLCFALYGNSISNGFSLDDEFVLKGDTTVQKGVTGIPSLFKSRYGWDQKGTYGYRPVSKISFAVESQFFGVSPHAGHVINIILYAVLVISLFYFLRKILYEKVSDYFLFTVAALFLAHPLHTEVVDSLKNRDEMLAFLLGLFSSYSFVKSYEVMGRSKKIGWIVTGCVSLSFAGLAKVDGLLFLTITPLIIYFSVTQDIRKIAMSIFYTIVSMFILTFSVRHALPESNYHRTLQYFEDPLVNSHWYQRLQLGFSTLWFYVNKLVFPKDLIAYYGFDAFHPFPKWTDIEVLAGVAVAGLIMGFLYKLVKRFIQNKFRMDIWLFSLLLFAGTIFIYINIIKVGPGIVAERLMFIPSVGFTLLVSLLLFKAFKVPLTVELKWSRFTNLYLVTGLVFFVYSARVVARNPDWMSHLSIYEHDAKLAPRSAKLQSLLAAGYMDEVKINKSLSNDEKVELCHKAEKAFQASIDVYPEYTTSYNNIGMIEYMYFRNPGNALRYFNKAVECDSTYTDALFNLASAYREVKNYPMSEKYFLKVISVNPKYDMAYTYLSKLYNIQGKFNEILQLNQNAIKQGYRSDGIYINIGKVYMEAADTERAIKYFDTALTYFNKNQPLCQWLANYYARRKDTIKARHYLDMKNAADDMEARLKSSQR